MISIGAVIGVALVSLGVVLTPGPNMVYLASRSIAQGRRAGLVSLSGVAVGFLCYLVATAWGLAALFAAVPAAFTIVKTAGVLYLLWLAWTMSRAAGTPFAPRAVAPHSPGRLFALGLATNLLNPKIALLYASLLPQFVDPTRGPAGPQLLQLGGVQIAVAVGVNAVIVLGAAALASFLSTRPRLERAQRYGTAGLLVLFAGRLAFTQARAA